MNWVNATWLEFLNENQRQSVADFLTTVAAAWFATGVIGPFFRLDNPIWLGITFTVTGTLMSAFFMLLTMEVLKEQNYA